MSDCAQIRDLLPELALGILSGSERDDALRHLEGCAACRDEYESFGRTADALLHVAPGAEPPSGFEARIVDAIGTKRPRRWPLITAALAAAAALVAAAGVYIAGAHDRHLAHEYNAVLGTLHGTSLRSAALRDAHGRSVGEVTLYEGKPSWIFVAVERGRTDGDLLVELGGRTVRGIRLQHGHGAFGGVVTGEVGSIRRITVTDPSGRLLFHASLPKS